MWSAAYFFTLKGMGMLRISAKEEAEGLDIAECGGEAYIIQEARVFKNGITGNVILKKSKVQA